MTIVPRPILFGFPFGHADALGLVVMRLPTAAEIAAAWRSLMAQRRGLQWAIGDLYNLLRDGAADHDDVADVLDLADISLSTAQRYGRVAAVFVRDPSAEAWAFRRRDLSFSHHSAVAGLVKDGGEGQALAFDLLDKAELDRMTTAEDLEDAVRAFRSGGATAGAAAAADGSPAAQLERLHAKGEKVLDKLPSDWKPERTLVHRALTFLASAWESARNREAGGLPADVLPVAEEVTA